MHAILFKNINRKTGWNTPLHFLPCYRTLKKAVLRRNVFYSFNWLRIMLFLAKPLSTITLKDKHIVFKQFKQHWACNLI